MKAIILALAITFSSSFVLAHDVPMAVFHISESNASLEIKISFDLDDFSKSTEIKTDEVSIEKMQKYLDENTSFEFNDKVLNLKVSEVEIVRDHIRVKGSFGKITQKVKELKIENNCLVNVSRHSNIIQVDLNNKSKDYRMHKKRTVINLKY